MRYGKQRTDIVFMDTLIEDDDNYRFMDDCRRRWGVPITVLTEGRTPYQVAEDKHIIPNQKIAPCTFRLKIELFTAWLKERENSVIHIGYDFTEAHRCEPTATAYAKHGWAVQFPLLWKPIETRPYPDVARQDWGIEPPRMYAMGYSHANCGGLCVKQGHGDWLRTLLNFPERYRQAEDWEQEMRDHPTRKNYAILRDRSGGETKPMTLREFRMRYQRERELEPLLFRLDYNSGCVHCGVGDLCDVGFSK